MVNISSKEVYAQLQLEMDLTSFKLLGDMMVQLDAASYGELVRRAVQLGDYFSLPVLVDTPAEPATGYHASIGVAFEGMVKRIHVRVSQRTKRTLDRIKAERGGSYSEIVTSALLMLAQSIRERESVLNGTRKQSDLIGNRNIAAMLA